MADDSANVTRLLQAWGRGDAEARDALVRLVYRELKRRAAAYLRRERADHTLQPTALVHEAYLRLVDQERVAWQNRAQFFGIAAQMMRRILVDHARRHGAAKRPGGDFKVARRPMGAAGRRHRDALGGPRFNAPAVVDRREIVESDTGGLSEREVAGTLLHPAARRSRGWQTRAWLIAG
jgi:hypothetical protein